MLAHRWPHALGIVIVRSLLSKQMKFYFITNCVTNKKLLFHRAIEHRRKTKKKNYLGKFRHGLFTKIIKIISATCKNEKYQTKINEKSPRKHSFCFFFDFQLVVIFVKIFKIYSRCTAHARDVVSIFIWPTTTWKRSPWARTVTQRF